MKKFFADIRSYSNCFLTLQSINIKASMAVPADWWIDNISFGFTQLTGLFFIWVVFDKIKSIAGWSLSEMVFLYGMQMLSMCIYRAVFQSVRDTPFLILRGTLDTVLTAPRNILFMLSVRRSNRTGVMDFILGMTLIVMASIKMNYSWDILKALQIAVFILSANLIMISIMMAQGALAFWMTNFDAFHEIVMALRDYTRYPVKIYGIAIRIILYVVIPVAFTSYVPASILLAKDGFSVLFTVLPPLIGVLLFLLAAFLFNKGLRNYTSSN